MKPAPQLSPLLRPRSVTPLQAVPSLQHARGEGGPASLDPASPSVARLRRSLSVGATPVLPAPAAESVRAVGGLSAAPSIAAVPALPTVFEAEQIRYTFAALEKKIHGQMSPWAREGVAILAAIGKSVSLGVGAVAAWLGFVLAQPHLSLVLGIAGAVWGGSILIGIVLELTLKYFAYAKVDVQSREKLTALCIELNAREKEFGSHRHLDEQHTCEKANQLWAQVHFNRSTLATTVVSSVTDYPLALPRPVAPMIESEKVASVAS